MDRTLIVKHSKDRHGSPLATVYGLPGDGADFSPTQLRNLARALDAIADEIESGPLHNGTYVYDIAAIGAKP